MVELAQLQRMNGLDVETAPGPAPSGKRRRRKRGPGRRKDPVNRQPDDQYEAVGRLALRARKCHVAVLWLAHDLVEHVVKNGLGDDQVERLDNAVREAVGLPLVPSGGEDV